MPACGHQRRRLPATAGGREATDGNRRQQKATEGGRKRREAKRTVRREARAEARQGRNGRKKKGSAKCELLGATHVPAGSAADSSVAATVAQAACRRWRACEDGSSEEEATCDKTERAKIQCLLAVL